RLVGLEPSRYMLHVPPRFLARVESVAARTSVVMIDKPAFIADLLDRGDVKYEPIEVERYDLVVDATGEARAYAPPLENDLKARAVQWRVRVASPAPTTFMSTRGRPRVARLLPRRPDGTELHLGAGCAPGTH